MSSKKTIIVVGGGAGGASASVALSKSLPPNVELILINPRPYRISLPASLRLVVSNTDHLENPDTGALVPYDKIFSGNPNARFVHASVTAVIPSEGNGKGKGKVVLNTNEQLEYDVLVLATGSKWGGAIDFPEGDEKVLMDYINARREEFKNAKEILIVGGGSVGIELAGEIKDIWPSKPITILQRDTKLLNSVYPDRFRNRIAAQLKARGVNLIFEDALDIDSEARIATLGELQTFKTKGGREVKADLVIRSFGSKPNTAFLSSVSSHLTPTGTLQVLPTLQLPGYPNIFALGDIIDWTEQKQAAKVALGHTPVVVHNVLEILKETDADANGTKLKEYKGSTEMIVVTNGKSQGLGYLGFLWGIVLPSWVAAALKSKTLMVAKDRAGTGN